MTLRSVEHKEEETLVNFYFYIRGTKVTGAAEPSLVLKIKMA